MENGPIVALAGAPNCGKTSLFNALTGSRQRVANYAGVTVERKEGFIETASGLRIRILDLPGTYSLDPRSPDETITRDVLLNHRKDVGVPDVLLAVADATGLERSLRLVLEVSETGIPVVLALNMMDLAQGRGMDLDVARLQSELGIPVVPTVAVKGGGIKDLIERVEHAVFTQRSQAVATQKIREVRLDAEAVHARYNRVDAILAASARRLPSPSVWTDRLDRVLLHPVWGFLILAVVLLFVFQALFTLASPLQDGIEAMVGWLSALISNHAPAGAFRDLIVDGVIAGVGAVIVFLPQILILFAAILVLEDTGYMARAAFLMDRLMASVGLHGRAFIPLLSSFACAIPGIMATRTIENRRDRLATIAVAPLMTCSARLPVYALLIAAFIPGRTVLGGFQLQGLVLFGLYVAGIVGALGLAWILKRSVLKGPPAPLMLELPSYRLPSVRNIALGLFERGKIFIRRAGTVILSLSVILWFLASYPKPEGAVSSGAAIEHSVAGRMGHFLEPVMRPIGFDWKISLALIPGFAAREVLVSALGTVYSVEQESEGALHDVLASSWTLATALSLLAWFVFAPQCLATVAVIRRETASWRWTLFTVVILTAFAYVAAWITYRVAILLGGG